MHCLRRHDVFRFAQNDVAPDGRNDAMFAIKCGEATHHSRSEHHWRSQHHLPKANIIQKSLICLVDKSGFFVGGAGGTRTHDLCVANAPLSQLSYNPRTNKIIAQLIIFVKGFFAFIYNSLCTPQIA